MINPCINCLVDVMCIKSCQRFTSFINELRLRYQLSYFVCRLYGLVNTDARFERILLYAAYQPRFGFYSKLYTYREKLLTKRSELI